MLWTAGKEVVVHPSVHKAKIDSMSFIRRHYEKRGFSEHVNKVLLDSWRPSNRKQWAVFCREWQITTLMHMLEFLHTQLHLSYSALNTARSALSCVISIDNVPVGQHPLVSRFVKGTFERKPPFGMYAKCIFLKTMRDQFTAVNLGSRLESCCVLSVQLLTGLRSMF